MKLYSWFSKLMVLAMLFMPISLTHAITMQLDLLELVDESEIVVKGMVKNSLLVSDNRRTQNILNRRLGTLYSIEVDKVLHGEEQVKRAIFALSNVEHINMDLENLCKRNPVQIFAFQSKPIKFPDGATYYKNRPQLFFLKISEFRASLPETVEIVSRSPLRRLTKSELLEKYYFEACFGIRQSTWDLAQPEQRAVLPAVEKFFEAMWDPNPDMRKMKLRDLANDTNEWLARSAIAALKRIP